MNRNRQNIREIKAAYRQGTGRTQAGTKSNNGREGSASRQDMSEIYVE